MLGSAIFFCTFFFFLLSFLFPRNENSMNKWKLFSYTFHENFCCCLLRSLNGDNEWHWTKTNIPATLRNFLLFSLLALVFYAHISFGALDDDFVGFSFEGQNEQNENLHKSIDTEKVLHSKLIKIGAAMEKFCIQFEIDSESFHLDGLRLLVIFYGFVCKLSSVTNVESMEISSFLRWTQSDSLIWDKVCHFLSYTSLDKFCIELENSEVKPGVACFDMGSKSKSLWIMSYFRMEWEKWAQVFT